MAAPKQGTTARVKFEPAPDEQHSSPLHDDGAMNAFEALHDLRVSVIRFRDVLRRLSGDGPREVGAVTLRAPLQQIETAARDIERWFNAHAKCVGHEVRIIYPTGEAR
jgi:hypothetical protein